MKKDSNCKEIVITISTNKTFTNSKKKYFIIVLKSCQNFNRFSRNDFIIRDYTISIIDTLPDDPSFKKLHS